VANGRNLDNKELILYELEKEEYSAFLGCHAVTIAKYLPRFLKLVMPPSSGSNIFEEESPPGLHFTYF
jgi:hypothetical protein